MRLRAFFGFGLALFGFICPAWGQETYISKEQQKSLYEAGKLSPTPEITGVINLFSSVLSYRYPKYLVPAYQVKRTGVFMLEMVPFGEDVRSNWSEMLTLQAISKNLLPPTLSAQDFVMTKRGVAANCSRSFELEDLGSVAIEGAEAHRVMFNCTDASVGKEADTSEMTIIQGIKRKDDLIVVQFAVRSKVGTDGKALMDEKKRQFYISLLNNLVLQDSLLSPAN